MLKILLNQILINHNKINKLACIPDGRYSILNDHLEALNKFK